LLQGRAHLAAGGCGRRLGAEQRLHRLRRHRGLGGDRGGCPAAAVAKPQVLFL